MRHFSIVVPIIMSAAAVFGTAWAADAPVPVPKANVPMVPEAGPGIFSMQKLSATKFHLVVTGHTFTSREAIEKYLAYRAADLTMNQHFPWFTFVENRKKGDTVPVPKSDPQDRSYSFRMEYFRPIWRYKITGASDWKNWSPFSGAAFFGDGTDPKSIAQFEVSADIALQKGMLNGHNPLAFDAGTLSDFLVNQVSPPQ